MQMKMRFYAMFGYVMGLNKMVGTVPKYDRCIHSEERMREGWMTPKGTHSEGRMREGWVVLEVCATTQKDECVKVWTSKGHVQLLGLGPHQGQLDQMTCSKGKGNSSEGNTQP